MRLLSYLKVKFIGLATSTNSSLPRPKIVRFYLRRLGVFSIFTAFYLSVYTVNLGTALVQLSNDDSFIGINSSASWMANVKAASSCSIENVSDNFPSISYSQNSGSVNWTGDWVEVGESDGVVIGNAKVRSNGLCTSGSCLHLGVASGSGAGHYDNRGVYREANLTGATSATLTFDYNGEGKQTVVLSISDNGGSSWDELKTYEINANRTLAGTDSFDISAYTTNNMQIRFVASGKKQATGMYIDDIDISYQPNCTTAPVIEYYFDELSWDGTPNEIINNVGNTNYGTAVGDTTTITAGQVCSAGTFDGAGDYINATDIDSYLSTTASISFWMNSSQSGSNTAWNAPGILGVEQRGGGSDIFWGYIDGSGRIRIQKGNGSSAASSTVVNNANWHHVVLTWDSASGVVQVYVNGNLEGSANSETGDAPMTGFMCQAMWSTV